MLRSSTAAAAPAPLFGHTVVGLMGLFAGAVLLHMFFYTEIPEERNCFIVWTLLAATSFVLSSLAAAYVWHFEASPQSVGVLADAKLLARCLYAACKHAPHSHGAPRQLPRPIPATVRRAA